MISKTYHHKLVCTQSYFVFWKKYELQVQKVSLVSHLCDD